MSTQYLCQIKTGAIQSQQLSRVNQITSIHHVDSIKSTNGDGLLWTYRTPFETDPVFQAILCPCKYCKVRSVHPCDWCLGPFKQSLTCTTSQLKYLPKQEQGCGLGKVSRNEYLNQLRSVCCSGHPDWEICKQWCSFPRATTEQGLHIIEVWSARLSRYRRCWNEWTDKRHLVSFGW